MFAQLLSVSRFEDPAGVVEWMGAVQAQDIRAFKWAVGLRMTTPSMSDICKALDSASILRAHIMRPTWHVVPAKDFGWMAAISYSKLVQGFNSWAKQGGFSPSDYMPLYSAILDCIHLHGAMTKQEICGELDRRGIQGEEKLVGLCLAVGEAEGKICNGPEKNGKHTYALYEERVAQRIKLSREEGLGELARRYFRSHGPASLDDFVWWSGLGVNDAKSALLSLGNELAKEIYGGRELICHTLSSAETAGPEKILHLLPPYDEYLISYKDRLDCIKDEHVSFAHNKFGIFQPVILHNGRITGNWRKTGRKTGEPVEATFFPGCRAAAKPLIAKAWKRYSVFLER